MLSETEGLLTYHFQTQALPPTRTNCHPDYDTVMPSQRSRRERHKPLLHTSPLL